MKSLGIGWSKLQWLVAAIGLGLGFGLQEIFANFVSGLILLFERPFRIGDEISVKDQRGVVENIGIRTTRLRNADNVQVIIPNAVVFAEVVANRTNEVVKPAPSEASAPGGAPPADGPPPPTSSPPATQAAAATTAGPAGSAAPASGSSTMPAG